MDYDGSLQGRYLLQQRDANMAECTGVRCFALSVGAAMIGMVFIAGIMFKAGWDTYRYRRALRRGAIPAKMLVRHWWTPQSERGDISNFKFIVRRPEPEEVLKETECPICLCEIKRSKWLVFSCGHATCRSCFKGLAARKKLHAACPLCRHLLADGEGDRGGDEKVVPAPAPETTVAEPV